MGREAPEAADTSGDPTEMIRRARHNAERVLGELDQYSRDLTQPWPRVAPDVIAEGRGKAERAAEAVRELLRRLVKTLGQ